MNSFVRLGFLPSATDFALLVLRVWLGFALFLRHGWEKIHEFGAMSAHFPNPLHIGSVPSLAFALLSDGICSILVMIGFATRWATLIIMINTGVAFVLVHKMAFFGPHQGELPWIYFGWAFTLFLAGPGRYSFDGRS
ncbi:MAG: DoxX family protein [Acidobacteriaceae bacterium]|nr:DoxX family protein [Acidobacteriaceae bacterium]